MLEIIGAIILGILFIAVIIITGMDPYDYKSKVKEKKDA